MKPVIPALLGLGLAMTAALGADVQPPPPPIEVPLDAYTAIGASLIQDNRLAKLGWTDPQIEAFVRGVRAGFHGQSAPADPSAQALFNEIGRRLQELEKEELRLKFGTEAFARPGYLQQYLKETRKQFGLDASDSGLSFGIRTAGFGVRPGPDDTVVISYKVTKADARTDLPQLQVEKLRIKVSELLPGLAEACQMMTVDSLAMLVLPPDLSYGDGKWPPGTDRGTPLLFTLKLHEVVAAR